MSAAQKPEDCDRLFAERVNAGDVDGVLALYEDRGCYVLRDGVATGAAAIRPIVEGMVAAKLRLVCDVKRVVRAGEGLALLYDDWRLTGSDDDLSVEQSGKALELVRRQADGTWLFVIDDPFGRT
ncbi:MAG TPA: nuclear transport factor 2 family protein [Thermoanaerobaculia bacterium]|nr:nuclear transport factor 2 family protein [Thermoanaerobaculia bacterium]